VCLNANTIKAPARGRTAVQHVDHFLLGADMYTCKPARTYTAALVSVGRIREDRELTINPDTLKSLPEASPGHQDAPRRQNDSQ
jgi:hypothetical protein